MILMSLVLLFPSFGAEAAGTPFDTFVSHVSGLKEDAHGRIKARGTMVIEEGKYSGSSQFELETAAGGYRAVCGDNEILSDGNFNYLVDNRSQEVTVADSDTGSRSVISNPLSVLFALPAGFSVSKQGWVTEGNAKAYVVELVPLNMEDMGLESLKLHIAQDGNSLTALEFVVSQGGTHTDVSVRLEHFVFSHEGGSASFTPDLKALEDAGYFINDLRSGF